MPNPVRPSPVRFGPAQPGPVRIVPVGTAADRRRFVDLPFRLNRDDPHWRPPIRAEMRDLISGSPRRNPWFGHARLGLWLALRGDEVVGRISAQVDALVQERMGPGTGQWGMFECVDDPGVAATLLDAAEAWLLAAGMTRALGPFSLSIWDECGLLVRGFDRPPTAMTGHNPAYHAALVEARGYVGVQDMHAYAVSLAGFPERVNRIAALGEASPRIRVRPADKSRLREEAHLILDILNDAWADNWGFVPMTPEEVAHFGRKLRPIAYGDLIHVAELDGAPVAFMLTIPDLNELTADLDGRLLPLGWAKLLLRLRAPRVSRIRVPLLGVRRSLQRSRFASMMAFMMIERTRHAASTRYGAGEAEIGWILDDNAPMRGIADAIGARLSRTWRIYGRALGPGEPGSAAPASPSGARG